MKIIRHAKIRRSSFVRLIPDAYVKAKKYPGWEITAHLFEWLFEQMKKRGFIQPHIENVEIESYNYGYDRQRKLLTKQVLDLILEYERNYSHTPTPDTHVVVMGEDTYFTAMKEDSVSTPFFDRVVEFNIDPIYNYDPYYGKRVMNWKVHVVPGMDGFMILPKVIIETRK